MVFTTEPLSNVPGPAVLHKVVISRKLQFFEQRQTSRMRQQSRKLRKEKARSRIGDKGTRFRRSCQLTTNCCGLTRRGKYEDNQKRCNYTENRCYIRKAEIQQAKNSGLLTTQGAGCCGLKRRIITCDEVALRVLYFATSRCLRSFGVDV